MDEQRKPVSAFDLPKPCGHRAGIGRAASGVKIETADGEVLYRVRSNGEAAKLMSDEARLAQHGRTAAEATRIEKHDVRIYEAGARVDRTVAGVKAYELRSMSSLGSALIHTGQVYGGVIEALQSTSRTGEFGCSGGGVGPRDLGAYIKPIEMGRLRDLAWEAVPASRIAMKPSRKARKAVGVAELGAPHRSRAAAGGMEDKRAAIPARTLIDMVCVDGSSLKNVLRVHQWYICGRNRQRLLSALAECLTDIAVAWNGDDANFGGDWCLDLSTR